MPEKKKTDAAGAEAQASGDTPTQAEAQIPTDADVTLPAYYEYTGRTSGSVFGQDHEPVGRFEPGQILKAETPEQAARVVALEKSFRRTTAARYNAQQEALAAAAQTSDRAPERTEQDVNA